MNLESYNVLVHAAVLFGLGQAHLTPEAKEILDRVGGQLLSASDYVAVVRGRTDSTGGDEYNLNLSKRRATEVARYLVTKYNVPAYRDHAAALGKERPLATNHTADGRRQNRSAEVDILSTMEERWPISPTDSDSDEEVGQLQTIPH